MYPALPCPPLPYPTLPCSVLYPILLNKPCLSLLLLPCLPYPTLPCSALCSTLPNKRCLSLFLLPCLPYPALSSLLYPTLTNPVYPYSCYPGFLTLSYPTLSCLPSTALTLPYPSATLPQLLYPIPRGPSLSEFPLKASCRVRSPRSFSVFCLNYYQAH